MTKTCQCDFFSLSDNFHAILIEKMRKYREIAPENDPCNIYATSNINRSADLRFIIDVYGKKVFVPLNLLSSVLSLYM